MSGVVHRKEVIPPTPDKNRPAIAKRAQDWYLPRLSRGTEKEKKTAHNLYLAHLLATARDTDDAWSDFLREVERAEASS